MNNSSELFITREQNPVRKLLTNSPFECRSTEQSDTLINHGTDSVVNSFLG